MSRMIEQILDFTRSRLGGGLALVFGPMDLREALTPIVDEARTAHPSATIPLRCPELRGAWDRDRLEQVFSNLIINALVHGDPAKPVTVTAGAEALRVWVEVHNEGPPIPQELQSVLFHPFRRGERESPSPAGLGLGLYISNELVLGHGGQIEIRSTAAEGTTFRVVLPRQAVVNFDDRGGEPASRNAAEAFGAPAFIRLKDGSSAIRENSERDQRSADPDVEVTGTRAEALDEERFHCVHETRLPCSISPSLSDEAVDGTGYTSADAARALEIRSGDACSRR